MKIKNKLLVLIQASLIALGVGYANISSATPCADNVSPTANCTDLVINTNAGVLVNNYTITRSVSGGFAVHDQFPNGTFSSFTNNGIITSNGISAVKVSTPSGDFINNGTIDGTGGGIATASGASIGTITNRGNIVPTSGNAIQNLAGGSIGSIINSGVIGSGSTFGIANAGTIGTITNTGRISGAIEGIQNGGTIGVINNANGSLFYNGRLPATYNVIINSPSDYGQMRVQTGSTGVMNFGIHESSVLPPSASATFSNVLIGVNTSNLSATTGMYAGGIVVTRWLLSNTSGNNWDLNTSQIAAPAPVSGSASGTIVLSGIATAYNAVAANPSAANPALANGQTFTTNVLSVATAAQANQIGLQANAEGYSSNRTIRLEQMNTVSNTVLDRIDSPAGKGASTTNRVQLDDGRYIWADVGGSRGNVNSYNNLASFGYNLVDMIIGGDVYRDRQKSYGFFGGIGYSDMTNSQTVVQNFNSTSYYLGGYTSYYFADKLKLSGVGGYIYSSNNSSRSIPSVAGFTGGNGKDSYSSNGLYAAAKISKDYAINDSITLVPFAGQSYAQFWTKGVTETGGGDFNVSIASATSYSAVTFAGLDLVIPLVKGVKDPLSLITFYKFGYDWFANSNKANSVTATYTNLPLAPQTYVGANMGPVSQQIGVGLQGAISKDISVRIGAVAAFNSRGQEFGGGAELRFKF